MVPFAPKRNLNKELMQTIKEMKQHIKTLYENQEKLMHNQDIYGQVLVDITEIINCNTENIHELGKCAKAVFIEDEETV